MGTNDPWVLRRVPVNPARPDPCACGAFVVRGDTGMCERCTARLKGQQQAWAAERARVIDPLEGRRSTPVPEGICLACGELEGPGDHRRRCGAKPYTCECGKAYAGRYDLRYHQRTSCRAQR